MSLFCLPLSALAVSLSYYVYTLAQTVSYNLERTRVHDQEEQNYIDTTRPVTPGPSYIKTTISETKTQEDASEDYTDTKRPVAPTPSRARTPIFKEPEPITEPDTQPTTETQLDIQEQSDEYLSGSDLDSETGVSLLRWRRNAKAYIFEDSDYKN